MISYISNLQVLITIIFTKSDNLIIIIDTKQK